MPVAWSEAATVTGLARCSLAPLMEQPLDTELWTSIISKPRLKELWTTCWQQCLDSIDFTAGPFAYIPHVCFENVHWTSTGYWYQQITFWFSLSQVQRQYINHPIDKQCWMLIALSDIPSHCHTLISLYCPLSTCAVCSIHHSVCSERSVAWTVHFSVLCVVYVCAM